MLISTRWLLDYLEPGCSDKDIVEALPKAGLEIDELHTLQSELKHVHVGFIREKTPLDGAPGLFALRIEIARGRVIPIVCASEHEVQVGQGVPVATVGTKLPTGATIAAGNFHGVHSEGAICLDGELGMVARGSGLQVFDDEAVLGSPLPSVIDVSEYLAEVNVLPNRPDCLGLIGMAREVAAILGSKLRYPANRQLPADAEASEEVVPVEIQEDGLCPRYMCQLLKGVKVASSPHWLKSRLLAVGLRPINNIVDVTNFILQEWGQPLHAFDFAKLDGGRIIVRRMAKGETIKLLNGTVLGGDASPLVIADASRPIALAGIMGGKETETTEQTVDVLVEAAHFEPTNIRSTVKKVDLGHETNGTASSHRFERGTDPNSMLEGALGRACSLILELGGGRMKGSQTNRYPTHRAPRSFRLTPQAVRRCLGTDVDAKTIRKCLQQLEMTCSEDLEISVPTWRVDVDNEVVLIEDVARLIGYDTIPTEPSASVPSVGTQCAADRLREAVAAYLVAAGFLECRNPSLESPEDAGNLDPASEGRCVYLANPASRGMSVIRQSLLPGLLKSAERNLRRGMSSLQLFEIDRVFRLDEARSVANEHWRVSGVLGGAIYNHSLRAGSPAFGFYEVKGVVENLLDWVGCKDRSFQPVTAEPYVPGAASCVTANGETLGYVGELRSGLIHTGTMQVRLFAFDLGLAALEPGFMAVPKTEPIARTPPITRDLAFVLPTETEYVKVAEAIRETAGPALEELRLVDVYEGPQVGVNCKSLAFHLIFRDPKQTLTTEFANKVTDTIVDSLGKRFGAKLRK